MALYHVDFHTLSNKPVFDDANTQALQYTYPAMRL